MEATQQVTLHLSLKKEWFNLMVTGQKSLEFREAGQWIASRLDGKRYTHVKFVNGYGPDKPYFVCEYAGHVVSKVAYYTVYEGLHTVFVNPGDYIIVLGRIVERGNINGNG